MPPARRWKTLAALPAKLSSNAVHPLLPSLDGLDVGADTSAAEQIAGWAPGARVVKAFNTIGFNIMANPVFGNEHAPLFYCGDDATAKHTVARLATDLGFKPVDAGGLKQARLLEPLAILRITLALKQGYGLEFAFALIRRETARATRPQAERTRRDGNAPGRRRRKERCDHTGSAGRSLRSLRSGFARRRGMPSLLRASPGRRQTE